MSDDEQRVRLRVACVGRGPGEFFLATLLRRELSGVEVVVFERNRATDAFGFGVVSPTRRSVRSTRRPVLRDALLDHGYHWDAIEVRVHRQRLRCGGNGMAAIVRSRLLRLMQEQGHAAGADLRFQTEIDGLDELTDFDLVVAADGANNRLRGAFADVFQPTRETASAKFIGLGTAYPYHGLTFLHQGGPHGVFAAHAYPIPDDLSTFIVETDEDTWRRSRSSRPRTSR